MWATVYVYVHSYTSATQGHCKCTSPHYHMMCGCDTLRGPIGYYIRYVSGDLVLSVWYKWP